MKTLKLAMLISTFALGGAAFAGTAPIQNHHCVAKDGTTQPKLTHKQCQKAGGQWKKDVSAAATPPAEAAPKAAPAPAPAAPAAPAPVAPVAPTPAPSK
jgi:hypothetical protein